MRYKLVGQSQRVCGIICLLSSGGGGVGLCWEDYVATGDALDRPAAAAGAQEGQHLCMDNGRRVGGRRLGRGRSDCAGDSTTDRIVRLSLGCALLDAVQLDGVHRVGKEAVKF